MTNREAAETLKKTVFTLRMGRANGKSLTMIRWAEAVGRAVAAIEQKEPRPVIIKGSIFERRYCPTCHERVKKGGRFCNACGQAYREPIYHAPEPPYHIPTPPPRGYGMSAGIIVFDELHDWKK